MSHATAATVVFNLADPLVNPSPSTFGAAGAATVITTGLVDGVALRFTQTSTGVNAGGLSLADNTGSGAPAPQFFVGNTNASSTGTVTTDVTIEVVNSAGTPQPFTLQNISVLGVRVGDNFEGFSGAVSQWAITGTANINDAAPSVVAEVDRIEWNVVGGEFGHFVRNSVTVDTAVVPEPSVAFLTVFGVLGLVRRRR